MSYRPYPDVARALHQVERGIRRQPMSFSRVPVVPMPRKYGRTAIVREIVDQALKAGEHVHVASRDGMRCAGGDDTCTCPEYKEKWRP